MIFCLEQILTFKHLKDYKNQIKSIICGFILSSIIGFLQGQSIIINFEYFGSCLLCSFFMDNVRNSETISILEKHSIQKSFIDPSQSKSKLCSFEQLEKILNEISTGIAVCKGKNIIVSNNSIKSMIQNEEFLTTLKEIITKGQVTQWTPINDKFLEYKNTIIQGKSSSSSFHEYPKENIELEDTLSIIQIRRPQSEQRKHSISGNKGRHKMMLLMSLSHELRNPVNGLLTMLPLLKEKLTDSQDLYYVDAIMTCAKVLNNYINNCLDYLSIESNEFELKKSHFNLNTFLQNALSLIMIQANRKDLVIDIQKGGNVPEMIYSDESRLSQVLLTLLRNAVKYTSEGAITIKITRENVESPNILFQVIDTGIGIPFEKQVELFRMFGTNHSEEIDQQKIVSQAKSSINKRQRVGFGLTIANMLCKYLGKELAVESEIRKGSCFSFIVRSENPREMMINKFKAVSGDKSKSSRNLLLFDSQTKLINKLRTSSKSTKQNIQLKKLPVIPLDPELPADEQNLNELNSIEEIRKVVKTRPMKFLSFIQHSSENLRKSTHRKAPTVLLSQKSLNTELPEIKQEVKKEKLNRGLLLDTPRLLARRLNAGSKINSPSNKALLVCGLDDSNGRIIKNNNQITTISFVPGKNLALNQEFLETHVGASKFRPDYASKGKRIYANAMTHLNHKCTCPIVLIVDDNEINKIALTGMLTRLGLKHREAGNGQEAIEVLLEENNKACCNGIRLVLMDCDMPVMDGITASLKIKELAKNGKLVQPTVVAVTAYTGLSVEKECLEAGMKEYISKPIDIDKMYDCIQRNLMKMN